MTIAGKSPASAQTLRLDSNSSVTFLSFNRGTLNVCFGSNSHKADDHDSSRHDRGAVSDASPSSAWPLRDFKSQITSRVVQPGDQSPRLVTTFFQHIEVISRPQDPRVCIKPPASDPNGLENQIRQRTARRSLVLSGSNHAPQVRTLTSLLIYLKADRLHTSSLDHRNSDSVSRGRRTPTPLVREREISRAAMLLVQGEHPRMYVSDFDSDSQVWINVQGVDAKPEYLLSDCKASIRVLLIVPKLSTIRNSDGAMRIRMYMYAHTRTTVPIIIHSARLFKITTYRPKSCTLVFFHATQSSSYRHMYTSSPSLGTSVIAQWVKIPAFWFERIIQAWVRVCVQLTAYTNALAAQIPQIPPGPTPPFYFYRNRYQQRPSSVHPRSSPIILNPLGGSVMRNAIVARRLEGVAEGDQAQCAGARFFLWATIGQFNLNCTCIAEESPLSYHDLCD
ncbi:hypothetical protein DFH06DRAFT_1302704 [Mycena polygramma]|nr:hypothetical protein DFH06DRAFT_1302704 [Mycena polygramma]